MKDYLVEYNIEGMNLNNPVFLMISGCYYLFEYNIYWSYESQ